MSLVSLTLNPSPYLIHVSKYLFPSPQSLVPSPQIPLMTFCKAFVTKSLNLYVITKLNR